MLSDFLKQRLLKKPEALAQGPHPVCSRSLHYLFIKVSEDEAGVMEKGMQSRKV